MDNKKLKLLLEVVFGPRLLSFEDIARGEAPLKQQWLA